MIRRGGGDLTVSRRAELLGLSRSSVYYVPVPTSARDLVLMRRLDELHLQWPFYGSRKLTAQLVREGHDVGRQHVRTLMRTMGIEALYRKPRTSLPAREAAIHPYLLEGLAIERPNQVWASDLTYIPMAHGFMYLVAILDVFSRKVLAWRVSNTMNGECCVAALSEAIGRFGAPEILNTDQGAQFTSAAWIEIPKAQRIAISQDGKGRWIDNVFIERLWGSVQYEDVYLRAYEDGRQLERGLSRYFALYNGQRLHEALDYRTPDELYFAAQTMPKAA
jgi:putative transposase